MTERDLRPPTDRDFIAEPAPQADPLLQARSRASSVRIWLTAAAAIAVIGVVIYGISVGDNEMTSTSGNAPAAGSEAVVTSPAPAPTGQSPTSGTRATSGTVDSPPSSSPVR